MTDAPSKEIFRSPHAATRVERSSAWLQSRPAGAELLVVGATREAALEAVRLAVAGRAAFGWRFLTLPVLARQLAEQSMLAEGMAPAVPLALVAVAARSAAMLPAAELGRYDAVALTPGFPRALARSLGEARAAGLSATDLTGAPEELAALAGAFEGHLAGEALLDPSGQLARASEVAEAGEHPLAGLPLLLCDVPVRTALEERLVRALVGAASACLATVPAADEETWGRLAPCFSSVVEGNGAPSSRRGGALERLQLHLFSGAPGPAESDGSVELFSAPGVSRECVEIARRILTAAGNGTPFDRMAILLRSPGEYQSHLEEALRRARVPAHFARGVALPDPAGRAVLALLWCRLEDLSARRFAEYLSVDELPHLETGAPPPALAPAEAWTEADDPDAAREPVDEPVLESAGAGGPGPDGPDPESSPGPQPPRLSLSALPRRWERLLGEAAVVGGLDRWTRRLEGLDRELALDAAALEDPDAPAADRIARDRSALTSLGQFALPLLADLAEWPDQALWSEHLARLCALATRAVREPERVLAVAASLAPLGPVGPVGLREVVRVLDRRLLELVYRPSHRRYGAVFVAPIESVRGLAFDIVFVPGLAERLMPRKVSEEPLLLDEVRRALSVDLETNEARAANERLLLALAAGSARERLHLSYPSLDTEMGRPRVPSFYTLEAISAAEGRLPPLLELQRAAAKASTGRAAWPAPSDPIDAIDEAEYDLSLLASVRDKSAEERIGAARYLLDANPHLARAIRARAQRWRTRWYPSDGLVAPGPTAAELLEGHRPSQRSFSPTALQTLAACPYRFYLHAVVRLTPREEPRAIDALNPLQRGSLIHDVQFELLTALRDAGKLPVTPENLPYARNLLDTTLDQVARSYEEDLAPAIERVWKDGVESVRADLAEWLRRASVDTSGYVPWRFELSFGLAGRRTRDEHSAHDAVELDQGLSLRGSIDLVERQTDGSLRVTDHKTGRARVRDGQVIAGGSSLQPVLYALVAEKLFDARVEAGRLYFCTTSEAFVDATVPLDLRARRAVEAVAETLDEMVGGGNLPAYPEAGACAWCDYLPVCGPGEELRTQRKSSTGLEPLLRLRGQP